MAGIDQVQAQWKAAILAELRRMAEAKGIDPGEICEADLVPGEPPKPEMGDIAFPLFPFAKLLKSAPPAIATEIGRTLGEDPALDGDILLAGPYLNVVVPVSGMAAELLQATRGLPKSYGTSDALAGTPVMIEFSCPNTNKPLHLGHLRNDALGESVARILAAAGAQVRKVNLINDRGIHICKSMLAYQEFGEGTSPEETRKKSDHFVGDYYVKFNQWANEDKSADEAARAMLIKWEKGDPAVTELWEQMNRWAIDGIEETYANTGVSFDQIYYESETYRLGKDEILKGLEQDRSGRDRPR